jgi:tetratricopeptide (TPR) repeat protein
MAQLTLWSMISQSFDPAQGEALAQEALSLARQLSDPPAEAKILWALMNLHVSASRVLEATDCGNQALALARDLNLKEQTAFILNDMLKCHLISGHFDLANQTQREAGELWRELGNLPMLADSLAGSASCARWVGDYDLALTLSVEAYSLSQSIANVWGQSYSKFVIGYIYWDRGQPDQAIAVMDESIRLAQMANYLVPQILTRTDLGALYASLGDSQRGIETMQLALDIANTRLPMLRPYVIGLLARVHVQQNHFGEAEALIKQAKKVSSQQLFSFLFQWVYLAEAELVLSQGDFGRALAMTDTILETILQAGMRSLIPTVLYLRGQCLVGMRQRETARSTLLEARAEAELIGSRWMLMQILPALASVESDCVQAEQLLQQAEEFKAYIADHSPPELRATFLS